MNPQNISRGRQDLEKQGDGRAVNTPGVYIHDQAGKVIETRQLVPGHVQADAVVQLGYRKATDKEVAEHRRMQESVAKSQKVADTRTVHRI